MKRGFEIWGSFVSSRRKLGRHRRLSLGKVQVAKRKKIFQKYEETRKRGNGTGDSRKFSCTQGREIFCFFLLQKHLELRRHNNIQKDTMANVIRETNRDFLILSGSYVNGNKTQPTFREMSLTLFIIPEKENTFFPSNLFTLMLFQIRKKLKRKFNYCFALVSFTQYPYFAFCASKLFNNCKNKKRLLF